MKNYFEEPILRVEKFSAEAVMEEGYFLLSGVLNLEENETKVIDIFSRPY